MDGRYPSTFGAPQLENRKTYRFHNSLGSIERIVVPTPRKLGRIQQCSPAAPLRMDPLYGEAVEELQTILHSSCDSGTDHLHEEEDFCSRPMSPPLRSSNPIVCNSAFERAGENESCTRLCLPSWRPPAAAKVRTTWAVSSV